MLAGPTIIPPPDYCSADHHLSHFNMTCAPDSKNLCGRPWASVDEMNEALIELWNDTVPAGATVWYLGDFAMGKIADSLPLVGDLNGDIHLFPGNHDRCFPFTSAKKVKDWTQKYLDAGFVSVQWPKMEYDGFAVSHFPYVGDSHDNDRYDDWRMPDEGLPLIHGHVHDSWQFQHSPNGSIMVNVGVDVWDYRPVSWDTILVTLQAIGEL